MGDLWVWKMDGLTSVSAILPATAAHDSMRNSECPDPQKASVKWQ